MQTASKKREKGRESSHICCLRVGEQEAGFCVVLFPRVTARCSLVRLAPRELLPLCVSLPLNARLLLHPPDRDESPHWSIPPHHHFLCVCVCVCLCAQSCLSLHDPMDYSPPGSSVPGTLQGRILEWVAISFFRGFSEPRDQTQISCVS